MHKTSVFFSLLVFVERKWSTQLYFGISELSNIKKRSMIFACDLQLAGKRKKFFCKRGRVAVDLALCCKCWTMFQVGD